MYMYNYVYMCIVLYFSIRPLLGGECGNLICSFSGLYITDCG